MSGRTIPKRHVDRNNCDDLISSYLGTKGLDVRGNISKSNSKVGKNEPIALQENSRKRVRQNSESSSVQTGKKSRNVSKESIKTSFAKSSNQKSKDGNRKDSKPEGRANGHQRSKEPKPYEETNDDSLNGYLDDEFVSLDVALGDWSNLVKAVRTLERHPLTDELMVHLELYSGKLALYPSSIVRKKCPQPVRFSKINLQSL
jgi:hypothetical protein